MMLWPFLRKKKHNPTQRRKRLKDESIGPPEKKGGYVTKDNIDARFPQILSILDVFFFFFFF